jgi:hypothetical protein
MLGFGVYSPRLIFDKAKNREISAALMVHFENNSSIRS